MRIIAGRLGGRQFVSPPGNRTHPMSDKMRGAIFNALGDIEGLTVLDAFAGSGALSFEALSRGAKAVTAIDIDSTAATTIIKNADELGISDKLEVVRANARGWQKSSLVDKRYDIVLCDPPYDKTQLPLIEKLSSRVNVGGLMVLSLPPTARLIMPDRCQPLSQKDYGDSTLHFYRRVKI